MRALLRALLFPPTCVGCRSLLRVPDYRKEAPFLCPTCEKDWHAAGQEICEVCREPIGRCLCVTEEMRAAHIEVARKLAYYRHGTREPIVNRAVYRIKEARDRRAIGLFAAPMAVCATELAATCGHTASDTVLVPLPRSRRNRLTSGTDQARELALAISERTGIPCREPILRVRSADREQKELSATERKRNAARAFRLGDTEGLSPQTLVILVDDLVTSGASMAAAARLLRRAGYRDIAALSALTDDVNRNGAERQPVIDQKQKNQRR